MRGFGNNDYSRPSDRRTARLSNLVCSLLFIVFSLVYLGVFQSDVIEALHYSLAHGKTVFALVPTTFVITGLLVLLGWVVNIFLKLKGKLRVLSFVPSFLGLVALTDVGRELYKGDYSGVWWWLMPLLSIVFVLVVKLLKKNEYSSRRKTEPDSVFLWNVFVMTIFSIVTLLVGNTDKMFHNELRIEHMMMKGDNVEALKVARKSMKATRTLTALRNMAMSKEKVLGERLFEYPQYYKAEGLFFSNDSCETLRYTNDSLYNYLGGIPKDWEGSQSFLKRICYDDTGTNRAVGYYVAALLLNKDLNEYAVAVKDFFMKGDSLQRYMKEAIVLYEDVNPEWTFEVDADSMVYNRFNEYKICKNKVYDSEKERENRLRSDFGDTYWWYYDYQK